jgi:hypothetical protein
MTAVVPDTANLVAYYPLDGDYQDASGNNTTDASGALVSWGSSDGTPVGGQYQSLRIEGGSLRAEHGDGNYRGATPVADGANLRVPKNQLFVDGQEDSFLAGGSNNVYNITADADVCIGQRASHGDRFFPGSIDEVHIYDRALSEAEIAGLAGRTATIYKSF